MIGIHLLQRRRRRIYRRKYAPIRTPDHGAARLSRSAKALFGACWGVIAWLLWVPAIPSTMFMSC